MELNRNVILTSTVCFAVEEDLRSRVKVLRANIIIAGDADAETQRKIAKLGYQYSPVSESIRNGVNVKPSVVDK